MFGLLLLLFIILFLLYLINTAGNETESATCYGKGLPHQWEPVIMINQFGEKVEILKCKRCKKSPGEIT